jgi:hypothetical protein
MGKAYEMKRPASDTVRAHPPTSSHASRITHFLLYAALLPRRCSAGSTRPHADGQSAC